MGSTSETNKLQRIDVARVLSSKNPSLAKMIPGFVVNYLKRIVHQDELNEFLGAYGHLRDAELIGAFLSHFQITYRTLESQNIPPEGRYIFVSNHPLGGLDGLVFMYELSKYYKEIRFPVNDILLNIENLSGIFLPVNKHGAQGREAAAKIEEAYASMCQILYFPAGLCSRKHRGKICDLQWHKSFITKAVQHKRDVVPVFFSGRNSDFFYNLANFRKMTGLKANIEMLFLADEMFKQRRNEISLVFGKPIPWQTFGKSKTSPAWAEWVKSKSYELESFIEH
jgi:putative hemolysin